jgi:hypothetical protein
MPERQKLALPFDLSLALPFAALGAVLLAVATPSYACGGFFCSTQPVNQVSERILFIPDNGTVTTHVQIEYNGAAPDFAWLLPVPSIPELSVSHNELFNQLQFATQPSFFLNFSEDSCNFFPIFRTLEDGAVAESAGGVEVVSSERIGPYDTVVITADDPDAVAQWLADNDYVLDGLGRDLLAPYVEAGMYFLALRLAPDREIGDLQPIAMTYQADRPAIPIRLTAVATQPDMGVQVWILGQDRAIPSNYLHVQINEARIDWFNGGFNYNEVVSEAADEADGQAFVTDYAGPAKIMDNRLFEEGRYDLDALRRIDDPATFTQALLRQGFPRDAQIQALLRRHIPIPALVRTEGILRIAFNGDQEAYDNANQNGNLDTIIESSFYNNMEQYEKYLADFSFDANAFADDINRVLIEPLRSAQGLFADYPYLTRLFTTLSADEMTLDPIFDFNPDLPTVDNVRTADARYECSGNEEEINFEDIVLIITLKDGREIRSQPFSGRDPLPLPVQAAAAQIERLDTSGPPEIISRATAIEANASTQESQPEAFDLLPNYPNPFNSGTVLPFRTPASARAALHIYNLAGQRVRTLFDGPVPSGLGRAEWDGLDDAGNSVSSGIYLYRMEAEGFGQTRKLLLLR